MNYWLFITTPDNWQISKAKNIVGYAERYKNVLSRVNKGDKCLLYITSWGAIDGEYEISSKVYCNNQQVFRSPSNKPDETFPQRLDLKRFNVPKAPIPLKPLIPKLSFIKNKEKWGGTFQGNALLRIPKEDYKLIVSSL